MKINRVKITKLFGYLNPDIKLDSDIKIIYGKNGTGKTTILRIINAVFRGEFYQLKAIKFQKLSCYFDDGSELCVSKANDDQSPATCHEQFDNKNLLLSLLKNEEETLSEFIADDDEVKLKVPLHIVEREIPELVRIGHKEWRHRETREFMSINDIIDAYGEQFPWLSRNDQRSDWYKKFFSGFDVRFIQTQRLISYSSKREKSRVLYRDSRVRSRYETVAKYSDELRDSIQNKLSESAQIGQELDSTFFERLFDKDTSLSHDKKKIKQCADKLVELRTKLQSSGLISSTDAINIPTPIDWGSKDNQRAIYLYLSDSLEKYQVFEDLEHRISLFTEVLNHKFAGSKTIAFSKESGIEVFTINEEKLDPRLLSSGEQHEIVLLYDLIFKASRNTLVLIDEPEISLHIDWQREFIKDLENISKLNHSQFLIATHSPSIVGNRIDIAQEIEQ